MTKPLLSAERVLLVEDEFLIAMDVEQICRDHGVKDVRTIHTFEELTEDLIAGTRIDAAILDIKISGESTVGFARSLRDRSIPFIFATGYSDMTSLFDEFPGVPVVGKPYAGDQVVEALASALSVGIAGKTSKMKVRPRSTT